MSPRLASLAAASLLLLSGELQAQAREADSKDLRSPQAATPDVAEFKLPSGVTVRLERVPKAKAMGLFVFVRGGYAEDPPGYYGIAHLLEHLAMCAKTPTREAWTVQRWMRERKAANAMTRTGWTVYYSIGDRDDLAEDARRFADVLAGKAEFSAELLVRERVRLQREVLQMTRLVPGGILQWRARAIAFGAATGQVGIGVSEDIQRMNADEIRRQYLRTHRPENAYVVAIGRVDPKLDRDFYSKVFGALKAAPKPAPLPARKPGQAQGVKGPGGSGQAKGAKGSGGAGQAAGAAAAKRPKAIDTHPALGGAYASLAFRAPSAKSPDFPAFALGATWLCIRAAQSFRFRGKEGLGQFMPGLYAMIEDARLVFINRRGEGPDAGAVREEINAWLTRELERGPRKMQLRLAKQQLKAMLDPLPRPPARAAVLARHPQALYAVGLARGAEHFGWGKGLWERIDKVDLEELRALIRDRFHPKKGLFVALEPKR